MSITKRQIINLAFEELGLGSYNYDLQPEDLANAVSRLDNLMAEWAVSGIQTGYPVTTDSDAGSIDDDIGLVLPLKGGVASALAVELAPGYGKTPAPDTKMNATSAYKLGLRMSFVPGNKNINNTMVPAGAGYKWRRTWRSLPEDTPNEILPGDTGAIQQ